jgi:hypothetical protein
VRSENEVCYTGGVGRGFTHPYPAGRDNRTGQPVDDQTERKAAMGLMDKVKAGAEIGMAKASEAGKAGQAKLDAAQAKHKADGLLRDLGAAAYADHMGRGSDDVTNEAARIVGELQAYEAEYGPIAS